MRRYATAAFVFVLCSGILSAAAVGQAGEAKASDGQQSPDLELLEAGSSPRRELRLQLQKGDEQTIVMTSMVDAQQTVGQQQLPKSVFPGTKHTLHTTVESVSEDGEITCAFEIVDAEVVEREGARQVRMRRMKQGVGKLVGLGGQVQLNDRGVVQQVTTSSPDKTDPDVRGAINMLEQAMRKQFIVAMPESPVGVGAKWRITSTTSHQGIEITQNITYTIDKITDDNIDLQVSITRKADRQQIESIGNSSIVLERMNASGSGNVVVHLAQVITPNGDVTLNRESVIVKRSDNQQRRITRTRTLRMKIEPAEKAHQKQSSDSDSGSDN